MKIMKLEDGDCFVSGVDECYLSDEGHCPCTDALDSLVDAVIKELPNE